MGGAVVVVGGTAGLGLEVARHYHTAGLPVVLTGRDQAKAEAAAGALGDGATGLGFDLAEPDSIARDANPVRQYDIAAATYLTTMKLVGYTATINTLLPQLSPESAVLLFGGRIGLIRGRPQSRPITTASPVSSGPSPSNWPRSGLTPFIRASSVTALSGARSPSRP